VDRAQNIDLDHSTLKRIIALLLSMAAFAERASVRPLPVRLLVFWLLRRALAVALTLLPVQAGATDTPQEPPPDDLIQLAACLRRLALLLAQACPPKPLPHPACRAHDLERELRHLGAWVCNNPDTS
jgi:hypothetical protein